MNLRHLSYFLAIADQGTVSAAARTVHVSQPALSRQLRQLETDLGVELFERRAGRLRLSREGRSLLAGARDVLRSAEALERSARLLTGGQLERLTVAAPTVTLTDVVAPFVAAMPPEDPIVDVRPVDGQSTSEMLDGGADLVIGGIEVLELPQVRRELAELPVWALVPRDDPWVERDEIGLAELVARPIICPPTTFTSRRALDAAVEGSGATYASLLEVANGTIAQAMAAAGRGLCVVSDDPRFDLVPLSIRAGDRRLTIRLQVAWSSQGPASPAIERIANRLADFMLAWASPAPHG